MCAREIDLEWASDGFLISKVLEETRVVLRASTDQIHCVSVGSAKLDIFAAIEECTPKVGANMKINGFDAYLAGARILGRCHLNKCPLVWMAGECTKEVPEVVFACRAGSNHKLCSSYVIA